MMTVSIGAIFVTGCTMIDGITCTADNIPTISHIIKHHYWDRFFALAITAYSCMITITALRAFYRRFYGIIS